MLQIAWIAEDISSACSFMCLTIGRVNVYETCELFKIQDALDSLRIFVVAASLGQAHSDVDA